MLDISRYAYRARLSAPAEASIQRAFAEAFERGAPTVRLTVRPILMGGAVARISGFKPEDSLVVTLDQMTKPSVEQARREAALLTRLGRNEISIADAAPKLQAGMVKFPFRSTGEEGCAQIVFSIWDDTGQRPLDYVVHTVSVRRKAAPIPACEENAAVQGGFTSMSGMLSATSALQVDAALHVMAYDVAGTEETVAMFLDAAKYRAARADKTLADRGLLTWKLKTSMEKYVGDKGELLSLITSARDTGNYEVAAKELKKRLFPPGSEGDEAGAAFSALSAMSSRQDRRPVVLVRARTAQNVPVFIPLAVLAARDAKLLSNAPVIIHPLPRERYASSTTCINRWSLGIPSRLDGAAGSISIPEYERMKRYETMGKLEGYLNPPAEAASAARLYAASKNPRGEGLVLLGHQEGGKIWFTSGPGDGRLVPEDYVRPFPPGSLAVLGACSTANPKGDNQQILELLNGLGIDVIVASPFPIEVSYGVELVRGMIESANEAYLAKKTPTVMELFQLATERAAKRLGAAAKLREKALEFVIVGDHTIRLCED